MDGDGPDPYIQTYSSCTTTHSTTQHKEQFLPITSVGFYFARPWARKWLEKRFEAGFVVGPDVPLMPVLLTS
eukprot:632716-Amphidinium_carterae.1